MSAWTVAAVVEPTEARKGVLHVTVGGKFRRRVTFGVRKRNRKDAFRRAVRLAESIVAAEGR